ncbi:MAG: hypothetical protein JWO38_3414 [Gemmataceae bacterium]|nr:hypothetical protein [Gemmataceae bacterium]
MRRFWLLSVGTCVLCVGLAPAQPGKPRPTPADSRTLVPPDPTQRANLLPGQAAARGFNQGADSRSAVQTPADRPLALTDADGRTWLPGSDARAERRTLVAPTDGRDVLIGRLQPNETGNILPEAAAARGFAGQDTARSLWPATRPVPENRRETGDR